MASKWCKAAVLALGILVLAFASPPVAAFLGDLTLDGVVKDADLATIARALGSHSTSANWNPEADLDLNGEVNVADLAIAGRSYGSERNFHAPRPLSNSGKFAVQLAACQDGSGRSQRSASTSVGTPR